jgi:uncharacterized protein involved in response to NO
MEVRMSFSLEDLVDDVRSSAPQTIRAFLEFAAILVAAVSRVCAAIDPAFSEALLHVAAFAWAAAFFGFALAFGPLLLGVKPRAKVARTPA